MVVVGGGFGGLQAAREAATGRRRHHARRPAQLPPLPAAHLPGRDRRPVAGRDRHPLRAVFKRNRNVRVLLAEVGGFDLERREVVLPLPVDGVPRPSTLAYDTLIVAGGSRYSYFGHDEWREHAPR